MPDEPTNIILGLGSDRKSIVLWLKADFLEFKAFTIEKGLTRDEAINLARRLLNEASEIR